MPKTQWLNLSGTANGSYTGTFNMAGQTRARKITTNKELDLISILIKGTISGNGDTATALVFNSAGNIIYDSGPFTLSVGSNIAYTIPVNVKLAKNTTYYVGVYIEGPTPFNVYYNEESGYLSSNGLGFSDVTMWYHARGGAGKTIDGSSTAGPWIGIEYNISNTAPTTPGAFTSPASGTVLKGGQNINLTWGPSTDPDGNLEGYILEGSYDSGVTWFSVKNPVAKTENSYLYTITTDTSKTKIRFRIRAYDMTGSTFLYSGYQTTGDFTISHNKVPTLSLNTSNNLSLSESVGQNEILVEGSANDTDSGNAVTVKLQIDDGTIRNVASALSDGATSIPFSKLLTYSEKKIWDSTTPISIELAENVDHKLKLWAEDGAGGTSVIVERTFRVTHNRPPVISGSNSNLGAISSTPKITYQVNDLEGNAITVTEKINGQVIRTFTPVANADNTLEIPLDKWIPLALQQHTLTIEATDSAGLTSGRTYTFTRTENQVVLELKNPFVTDIAATRILVTPEVYIPIGASILIEACNNAFDVTPTWEDITSMAMGKRGYNFTNTVKTADEWGINIRFTLNKGTATQEVRLDGFGGAFE